MRFTARPPGQVAFFVATAPALLFGLTCNESLSRQTQSLYFDYERGMVGNDVVVVEGRTERIMDIIRDVTARR